MNHRPPPFTSMFTWFMDVPEGTFEDDVTIPPTKMNDQQTTDYLVKSGISHKFKDDHIWWSIFSKPLRYVHK